MGDGFTYRRLQEVLDLDDAKGRYCVLALLAAVCHAIVSLPGGASTNEGSILHRNLLRERPDIKHRPVSLQHHHAKLV